MTVNVGVIGVGMIGQDHIRRLTYVLSGARVSAVTDVDLERAKSVAQGLPGEVAVHATGRDLINDDAVDAVVVASWGPTHEEFVLAGIEAGKQVFCEKPLATTREACDHIVDAVPPQYVSDMIINDTCVHDVDMARSCWTRRLSPRGCSDRGRTARHPST
ncbi:MAG TPA: Gfo/Idh/MocA family oxidoreductase [Asanoa sp.]